MREDLLGYLLGAMQPEEKREFERRLQSDAELRSVWLALREAFPAETGETQFFDPPAGLARRTCEFIAQFRAHEAALHSAAQDGLASRREPLVTPPPSVPVRRLPASAPAWFAAEGAGESRGWRLTDYVTLAGLTLAASLLLFPALASWRYQQHATACREKLHQLGTALVDYSRTHNELFPEVAERGPLGHAGVYAPRLHAARLITDASDVLCPGTAQTADPVTLPTLAELQQADPTTEAEFAQRMGGGYGYALGYVEEGKYHPLRNRNRATFAVLADTPGTRSLGSVNHGCGGQNVLFEDGHAAFLNRCRLQHEGDQLFRNTAGFVGAGIGPDDVVIGTSEARPLLQAPTTTTAEPAAFH